MKVRRGLPVLVLLLCSVVLFVSGCGEEFSLDKVHHDINFFNVPHHPWHIGPGEFWQVNSATLIYTWLAMALTLLIALAVVRGASVERPTKLQSMFEMMMEFLRGLIDDTMAKKKGDDIFLTVVTFFFFILICNLVGIIPTCMAPTADHQTTFGFALVTFALMYIMGIKYKGAGGHFKHFLQPFPYFLPITLIEEAAKPVTLAFRLFGNMKGKEIMILALLGLITGWSYICGGFLASVVWYCFCVFVSFIQAFVFTMLTISYVAMTVMEEH
ncbi:MAG TPA: F0F1 ATP synthase subunit A [Desulfotomaculum sp.]|nr:F0F1 ATP synthase subunit A [Desulfotomaculum sp.]